MALPGIRMSLPGCCLRLATSPMTSLVIRVAFCQSTDGSVVETTSLEQLLRNSANGSSVGVMLGQ